MLQTVQTLLSGIVDDAGLFPPAGLSLENALHAYARYRAAPGAWLLARFLCPVAQLDELTPLCERLFTPEAPCRLAVIGAQHPLSPEFLLDVRALDQFNRTSGARTTVEALEVRIPRETIDEWDPDVVAEGLNVAASRLLEHHFGTIEVFLEPIFGGDWNESVRRVVAALQRHDQEHGTPTPGRIAFKLRTGGTHAAAFPTVAQVAFALNACRDAEVPLKFTGGLHHALRCRDATLGVDVHGFLNLFLAGTLLLARGVDEPTLQAILDERDIAEFTFTDPEIRWHDLHVTAEELETARRELTLSFGSAYFEAVRAELKTLGLW